MNTPVFIKNFPIPPSDNDLRCIQKRYVKGERRKVHKMVNSKIYEAYKKQVNLWWMYYNLKYDADFKKIRSWAASGTGIAIEIHFRVHDNGVRYKNGELVRIDAANRLKAFLDVFSRLIGFDDSAFVKVSIEKIEIDNQLPECFYIYANATQIRRENG